MEKYRREGSVVRLQTGLGATVRGARAGCARAGALQGTGGAAVPTSEGFLLPPLPPAQSSYRRFNGTEGLQDLHLGPGEQSARSAAGRSECVGGRGGLIWEILYKVGSGVLVKEGWGWLRGRWGICGAGICHFLWWWQKCRLCLPT